MKKQILFSAIVLHIVLLSNIFASWVAGVKPPVSQSVKPDVQQSTPTVKWLVILNDFFARDENKVYGINDARTGWENMPNVDKKSFKVILGRFAQDKNTMYYLRTPLEWVDRKSFVVISGTHGYASDDKYVYGPNGILKNANPETFKLYTGKYGADSWQVYYMGQMIDADSVTFRVLEQWSYALDNKKVFYNGKELRWIPVLWFYVKGDRGYASDGHIFYQWRVEKWDPLPGDAIVPTTDATADTTPPDIDMPVDRPLTGESITEKLFPEGGMLTPYRSFLTIEWPFFAFLGLVLIGIWSACFVFFAERNDSYTTWMKTFLKTLFAVVIGGILFWILHFLLPLYWSMVIGGVVAAVTFFFLSQLGWFIKTFFIFLISSIAFGFFVSVGIIVSRTFNTSPEIIIDFMTRDTMQIAMILWSIGILFGSWLVRSQLKTSVGGAITSALLATIFSLLILAFVYWLWPLYYGVMALLFILLFGAFLWVLSFRWNNNLFLTSVRVLRIMIFLWIVVAGVVFLTV